MQASGTLSIITPDGYSILLGSQAIILLRHAFDIKECKFDAVYAEFVKTYRQCCSSHEKNPEIIESILSGVYDRVNNEFKKSKASPVKGTLHVASTGETYDLKQGYATIGKEARVKMRGKLTSRWHALMFVLPSWGRVVIFDTSTAGCILNTNGKQVTSNSTDRVLFNFPVSQKAALSMLDVVTYNP